MKKSFLTFALVATAMVVNANARLRESREAFEAHMGPPFKHNELGTYFYKNHGWIIGQAYNTQGLCWWAIYIKSNGANISRKEADTLDQANLTPLPVKWVFEHWTDTDVNAKTDSYFDPESGQQLIVGWCLFENAWRSSRTFVDVLLKEATSTTNNDDATQSIPL
jgi:hypothetical protein